MSKTLLYKIARDLGNNRFRSGLIIVAMITGLTGFGMILNSYSILKREIQVNYERTTPASAVLLLDDASAGLAIARNVPGVGMAEVRDTIEARIRVGSEWQALLLFVIPDFQSVRLDAFFSEQAQATPRRGELFIERVAFMLAKTAVGRTVTVQLPGKKEQKLLVSGGVHAPGLAPAWMERTVYGYITPGTARLLGGSGTLKELLIRSSGNWRDGEANKRLAYAVRAKLAKNGIAVERIVIPRPGQHPHAGQMNSLLFLIGAFGILAFILSSALVASMVAGFLAREVKQIGIMKAIGARTAQIAALYFSISGILSFLALLASIPLSIAFSKLYVSFAAKTLNFTVFNATAPHLFIILQVLAAGVVPALMAAASIIRGSRIPVRVALVEGDASPSTFLSGMKLFSTLPVAFRLSLRNAVRKPARLLLTVCALGTGGGLFISAQHLASSITTTVDAFFATRPYEVSVTLHRGYAEQDLLPLMRSIPGCTRVSFDKKATAVRVLPDGTESNAPFPLIQIPAGDSMLRPMLRSGSWLSREDTGSIVVNHWLADRENLTVGETITIRMGTTLLERKVVGIIQETMGMWTAYAWRSPGDTTVNCIRIGLADTDAESQVSAVGRIESILADKGMEISTVVAANEYRVAIENHLLIIVSLLRIVSLLVVAVGLFGLSSAVSISTIEQTREIGILRSVGAGMRKVILIYIVEGGVIGVLGWILASILSFPLATVAGSFFGNIFFRAPLAVSFSPHAIGLWCVGSVLLAVLSAWYPAWKGAGNPVNTSLRFE